MHAEQFVGMEEIGCQVRALACDEGVHRIPSSLPRSLLFHALPCSSTLFHALPCHAHCCAHTTLVPLGRQVEQPFELMPLWQLCHIMAHDAEACIAGDAPGHIEGIF